jgi:hypothetical protein
MVVCAGVSAQETRSERADEQPSRVVSANTGEILVDAQDLLNAGDHAGALERLASLRIDRLSPYERGRAEYVFFAIAFAQEKYDEARAHLDAMSGSGGLNERELSQARYEHARLYLVEERWSEGAASLSSWLETAVDPNQQAYYLIAVAYYQLYDYDRALAPAKTAVDLTAMRDVASVQLLLAIYGRRAEYGQGIPLLERLIVMSPQDKRWWLQLSTYHSLLENHERALAVLELARLAGLIAEDQELLRLADLLAMNAIPYRCAKVVSAGLEARQIDPNESSYEKAAHCLLQARELAASLAPLTQAAELAASGDNFVLLAEVQMQRRDWDGVVSAADRGIAKGDLDEPLKPHLLKGVALYNLGRKAEARESLERALPAAHARELIAAIDGGH